METVVLVIHLMVAVTLVGVVLLQRSEGGALGIGGGGGGGGFMSARGAGDLLTRVTAILAAVFFCTSIALTIIARQDVEAPSILDSAIEDPLAIPDVDDAAIEGEANPALDAPSESPQTPVVPDIQ